MDDLRSQSYKDSRRTQDSYGSEGNGYDYSSNPSGFGDLRCYSASYASSSSNNKQMELSGGREIKLKKAGNGGSVSKSWSFSDPELQRKKRVASYKVYTVEGKVKGSIKKSFRWIKDRFVYGWRS